MRGSEFAELKAFAAVVERASFARAADHLGLSPSALSQTIRQLEARLGVRLLNRTTRSVAPTEAGSRLHERIAPMMREMDDAVAEAVAATGRTAGMLRINTLGMGARKIIAPRLGRFHRANPDVVLDIVIDDGLSDIVAGRFDAGIRVGGRLEKDMIAVRLTPDVNMLAVASPDYLARRVQAQAAPDAEEAERQHHGQDGADPLLPAHRGPRERRCRAWSCTSRPRCRPRAPRGPRAGARSSRRARA